MHFAANRRSPSTRACHAPVLITLVAALAAVLALLATLAAPHTAMAQADSFSGSDPSQPPTPTDLPYGLPGGITPPLPVSPRHQEVAAFAVATLLGPQHTLVDILSVREQVVAGVNYFLVLKARGPGPQPLAVVVEEWIAARVYARPWESNYMEARLDAGPTYDGPPAPSPA